MKRLSGESMHALLDAQISQHSGGLYDALEPLDRHHTTRVWLSTLHAVEEFINIGLCMPLNSEVKDEILSISLSGLMHDVSPIAPLIHTMTVRFSKEVAQRFVCTVIQAAAMGESFRKNNLEAAAQLQTIRHAVDYFQSRRRHMVAMLYTLPEACRGSEKLTPLDAFNRLLVPIELYGLTLVGLHEKRMLAAVYPNFELLVEPDRFSGSHNYEPLDSLFLDPERASLNEVIEQGATIDRSQFEDVDHRKISSPPELRNAISFIKQAYAEFGLADSSFGAMSKLIADTLVFCNDDFSITIPDIQFDLILARYNIHARNRHLLIHQGGNYVTNIDVFCPFIKLGESYISTLWLMQRFLYQWKDAILNKQKRFQIRSGFIFEKSVRRSLVRQGFKICDFKRINNKEFDVVAVLGEEIFNLQCKNNLVDLSRIASDPKKSARYHKQLGRYYAKALEKEEARESLLIQKLQLSKIRHFVISRFAVATENPKVIAFKALHSFRSIVSTNGVVVP